MVGLLELNLQNEKLIKKFVGQIIFLVENLIDEYARQRGIYTQDNKLAHRLHQIATQYEEYNYENMYDRR